MIVYLVRNLQNGKVYIGQTTQRLETRWKRHIFDSQVTDGRPVCVALCNALKKYGAEAFKVEQIGQANTKEELDALERHWISVFDSTKRENGYNLTFGGEGSPHLEETKRKISNSGRGKKRSKEFCEKLRKRMLGNKLGAGRIGELNGMFGKKHSEETKEKMSKSPGHNITGKKHPLYGKALSKERKQEISNSLKGNQYHKGIPHSPEVKARISESLKRTSQQRSKSISLALFLKTVAWG